MRAILTVSAVLLLGSGLAACGPETAEGSAPENAGPPPVKVEAVEVTASPFNERTWLPAEIQARERARVSAEAMGRITWICCEENERVRKGQLLARIDTALNQAQVDQARANLELAERQYGRVAALEGTGAATPQQIDQARSQRDAAKAALDQALAAKRKTTLVSPIAGKIAVRHKVAGEIANPGEPIYDIADISQVKAVAGLPERDFAYLQSGEKTAVRIDAYPDRLFEGTVTRLGLVAGAARTFPVEITLENDEELLRPGMVGSVRLDKRSWESVVVIPLDAVVDEYDSRRVYVVGQDGNAAEREVVLGPRSGRSVAVLEGLRPGDRLVVTGHRFLTQGRSIDVVRTGSLDPRGLPRFEPVAQPAPTGEAAPPAKG